MGPMSLSAQSRQWSLRECCDYAVAHNIAIKQQENACRQQELQDTFTRSNVDHVSIATNEDYVKQLLGLFKQRS